MGRLVARGVQRSTERSMIGLGKGCWIRTGMAVSCFPASCWAGRRKRGEDANCGYRDKVWRSFVEEMRANFKTGRKAVAEECACYMMA